MNPSGINPTEFKCVILPKPVEEKTSGGIIIPDSTKDKEKFAGVEGTLIAAAPGAFKYMTADEWGGREPKVGDRVLLAKYAGTWRKGRDGVEYVVMNDKDIIATLEG